MSGKGRTINKRKPLKASTVLLQVALIIWAVIQLFPLYWMFTFSLKNNAEIFGGNIIGLPQEWQWSNYTYVFNQGHLGRYFLNSVIVSALTIFFTLLLSSMATYALVRLKWRLRRVVYLFFLVGMMIALHAVLLPLYVNFSPVMGTRASLVLPYTAFALPMSILLMVGSLESIPKEMEEAAFIDGASIYMIFFKIIIPVLVPILSTVAIIVFLDSWNELMLAMTFINDEARMTLTVGVNNMIGKYHTKWGYIGAGLTIATIPSLVLYSFLSKNIQNSLTAGAVKG